MQKPLWKFTDQEGSFSSFGADKVKSLYFPLCNSSHLLSSVSPDLHGDLKTNFNSFLLAPASRAGLSDSRSSRNFWITLDAKKIWSAAGVSKDLAALKTDGFRLDAGLLWQTITRTNKKLKLQSKITSFIPSSGEPVEIMLVEITNLSKKTIAFIPTAAIPLFARSGHNIHDHRHVTSLLMRTRMTEFGVIAKPTLFFDEAGHKKNQTSYFVLGIDGSGRGPEYIYATQSGFCGDHCDLEAPQAIYENILPDADCSLQGKEAFGGLRFKKATLKPGKTASFTVLLGITEKETIIPSLIKNFNTPEKIFRSLKTTEKYWQTISKTISVTTPDKAFDNWLRWINIQPTLRKIFGCSFLPDFDYGRGGRGWRDLWQDCLSLILTQAGEARSLLINNFSGIRIDGSNATIIGQKPGEFIADRNNISRVWMDHGVWPLITTHLYINMTSDLNILFEKTPYFRDTQLSRSTEKDLNWTPEYGKELKTKTGKIYNGTILEHLLVENLVQFFNVGPHNIIRLENADWNDGLDMAGTFGESAAFSALYAQNFYTLCEILEKSGKTKITMLEELLILLDTLTCPLNYASIAQKRSALNAYFKAVTGTISGRTKEIDTESLILDLRTKANWLTEHLRRNEWLAKEGFFNGYYNNHKERVEGSIKGLTRMTLTGQVFPIMSGVATIDQVTSIFKNAKKHLHGKGREGFRLNTDFKSEQLDLGRAFSFVYGEKENGAYFNHMAIMFAYGLYKRGFAKEGAEVIDSIFKMACAPDSKIYPCLPEYFNAEGRGMYSYLTGSASWFMLTMQTQVFGIRGEYGDFVVEPKLTRAQFKNAEYISMHAAFAEKPITVKFLNPMLKEYCSYGIIKVVFNGKILACGGKEKKFVLKRADFLQKSNCASNTIEITLG